MKWDEGSIALVLKEMHAQESIPSSPRRAEIRTRILAGDVVSLAVFETRLGWMGVAFSPRGIVSLQLPRAARAEAVRDLQRAFSDGVVAEQIPEEIAGELADYAEGRCRAFNLPLDLSAVKPFQLAVLSAISRIPFGETRSYGWVARAIGRPGAARAVGQALHTNPIPIIIPCHRVIASNGHLGGYGGGLEMKKRLLQLEGAALNL